MMPSPGTPQTGQKVATAGFARQTAIVASAALSA
jgi:hypothetical protein